MSQQHRSAHRGIPSPSARQRNQQTGKRHTRLIYEALESRFCLNSDLGLAFALTGNEIYGVSDMDRDAAGNFVVASDQNLQKYSATGTLLWNIPVVSAYFKHVDIDAAGNVYAAGIYFSTTLTIGGASATTNGQVDWFLFKFNSAGQALWGRSIGGIKGDEIYDISVDSAGNVYAVGEFSDTMTFAGNTMTSAGGTDAYVVKVSPNNVPLWGRRLGGTGDDDAIRADVDSSGNIYFIGEYNSAVTVSGSISLPAAQQFGSRYVAKLTSTGNFAWAQGPYAYDGGLEDGAIAVDPAGSVVIFSNYDGTPDLDLGPGEAILSQQGPSGSDFDSYALKLSLDGQFIWAKGFGGDSFQDFWRVAIGPAGNIYVAGVFHGQHSDFDPSERQFFLAPDTYDAYLLTLSTNGDFIAARNWGGGSVDEATGLAVDSQGRVYLAGSVGSGGTVDMDPGAGTYNLTFGNSGNYIMRLDPNSSSVETRLWNDLDGDGLQDADEPGLAGAVVQLYASPDAVIGGDDGMRASVITDETGRVRVDGLLSGNYYFVVRTPAGLTIPTANVGSNELLDNDLLPTGNTAMFTLDPGELKVDQDLALTGTLRNFGMAFQYDKPDSTATHEIFTDAAGYIYLLGKSSSSNADLDPGPGTLITNAFTNGAFVAKYTPSGALVWYRPFDSSTTATDLAFDAAGNIYVLSHFSSTLADVDPGTYKTREIASAGSTDILLVKLDSDGQLVWFKQFGSTGAEVAGGLEFDAAGNLVMTGRFTGTVNFAFLPTDSATLTSAGNTDAFAVKIDLNAGVVWAKNWGGTALDAVSDVKLDAQGNVYLAGFFSGTADFDPNAAQTTNLTSAGSSDAYLSKLNADGTFAWAVRYGNTSTDDVISLALDPSGNVITVGSFSTTINIGGTSLTTAGSTDGYIAKWNASGSLQWLRQFGGTDGDSALGVTTDAAGAVYVSGSHGRNGNFGDGTTVVPFTSVGTTNAFVEKFSASGQYQTLYDLPSSKDGRANSVVINPLNHRIHVAGEFIGTVDFDPAAGSFPLTSASTFQYSAFVGQIIPDSEQPQLSLPANSVTEQQGIQPIAPLMISGSTHETYTLRIVSGPAGVFSISGNNLIADSRLINYSLTPMLQVEVQAIGSHGSLLQKQFTINVQDINVAPVVAEIAEQNGQINVPVAVNGSFSDLDAGDVWEVMVDYGDGDGIEPLAFDGNTFALNHTYTSGGYYQVTVVVSDAEGLTDAITFQAVINPLPLPVIAFTAGSHCGVRGETLQFAASATGGTLPAGANTITWNFGDGSPPLTLPVASAWQNQAHLFSVAGEYTVTVTLNAGDGRTVSAEYDVTISPVEVRTDPGNADYQTLVVGGTTRPDVLRVVPGSAGELKVFVGRTLIGTYQDVERVELNGADGDDMIIGAGDVDFWLQGGAGNDTLMGNSGNDVLQGGSGDDLLRGGAGRDILVGGTGIDLIDAGDGEDLLVASELNLSNLASGLIDIHKEWTSTRTFVERVDNLKGDNSGPRDNGTTLLLVNQTVVDDVDADTLLGGADNDWFFADEGEDAYPDLIAGDVLDLLG
ncbi:PKD domain-containing protein [Anatilimnocola floriformis]|uniref:PKD domain-containing protein n=1 Tax=Anatilimnocola floriformis TaxID=2948575 RepID=UPI0021BC969D|nr:PKD domain-containing protein [Anatilimnocola floriformis]